MSTSRSMTAQSIAFLDMIKTVSTLVLSVQAYYMAKLRFYSISLLFRIVSSQNQFYLPLFMINMVNVTLLRQFLGLYCLSKLIIRFTHDVFLISFLFRIVCN